MKYINEITDYANQSHTLTTDEGYVLILTLRFLPTQNFWMADIAYNDFVLNGIRLVNSFNILKQYINILPFGIACISDDLIDPFMIQDFSLQRSRIYLLNSVEAKDIQLVIKNL